MSLCCSIAFAWRAVLGRIGAYFFDYVCFFVLVLVFDFELN